MLIGCWHWGSALGYWWLGGALGHHSGYCVRVRLNHLGQLDWVVPWGCHWVQLLSAVRLSYDSIWWPLVGDLGTIHNLWGSPMCNIEWSLYGMSFTTMSLKVHVPGIDLCSISRWLGQWVDVVFCWCTESLPVHAFKTINDGVHRQLTRLTRRCSLRKYIGSQLGWLINVVSSWGTTEWIHWDLWEMGPFIPPFAVFKTESREVLTWNPWYFSLRWYTYINLANFNTCWHMQVPVCMQVI